MTPIINPMWFYWLEVFNGLGDLLFGIGIFGFGLTVTVVIVAFMTGEDLPNGWLKKGTILITLFGVLVVISIFMPSQETMYKMMLANYATTDNITEITNSIQDGVDYIFDKIEKVDEDDND